MVAIGTFDIFLSLVDNCHVPVKTALMRQLLVADWTFHTFSARTNNFDVLRRMVFSASSRTRGWAFIVSPSSLMDNFQM